MTTLTGISSSTNGTSLVFPQTNTTQRPPLAFTEFTNQSPIALNTTQGREKKPPKQVRSPRTKRLGPPTERQLTKLRAKLQNQGIISKKPEDSALQPSHPTDINLFNQIGETVKNTAKWLDQSLGIYLPIASAEDSSRLSSTEVCATSSEDSPELIDLFREQEIPDSLVLEIIKVWKTHHIPLNEKTIPKFYPDVLTSERVPLKFKKPNSSGATFFTAFASKMEEAKKYVFKNYPAKEAKGGELDIQAGYFTGIDPFNPQPEARNILAYLIDQKLGWGIVPETFLGIFDGKPWVVTEFVSGLSQEAFLNKNPHLSREEENALEALFVRADLLGLLFGDPDRHGLQYRIGKDQEGKLFLKSMDFDQAFGAGVLNSKDLIEKAGAEYAPQKPAKISETVYREFLHLTADDLDLLSTGLLKPAEKEALLARFSDLRKILGTLKKQGKVG